MTSTLLERAHFFMEQERWSDAVRELRSAVSAEPDNPYFHALLALCLSSAKQPRDALDAARRAIEVGPDQDFSHYAMASVLDDQDKLPQAERAVREAIRLNPANEHYFALLASILYQQTRWEDALRAAETGLEINSEDVTCTNLRAMSLVKLGRQDHAHQAIDTAMAVDPENPVTHANRGWTRLHQNQPREAFDHFREALRLDPNQDWAREGIIHALKARNPVYRVMLAWFLWMSRLSSGARTALIIGLWFGHRIVRQTARTNPDLAPYLAVVSAGYLLFVFLCWTAEPLFDLLLRLDPVGRMALTPEKVAVSNWVGGLLMGTVVSLGIWMVTRNITFAIAAGVCGTMILPVAGAFGTDPHSRPWLKGYAVALGFVGLAAVIQIVLAGTANGGLLIVYALGFVVYTWIGGMLGTR